MTHASTNNLKTNWHNKTVCALTNTLLPHPTTCCFMLIQHRWDDLLHQLFLCRKHDLRIVSQHQTSQPWILHCKQCNISCCNIKNKILQKPLLCYIILPIRVSTTILFNYGTRVHMFPFLAFLFFSLCINLSISATWSFITYFIIEVDPCAGL